MDCMSSWIQFAHCSLLASLLGSYNWQLVNDDMIGTTITDGLFLREASEITMFFVVRCTGVYVCCKNSQQMTETGSAPVPYIKS